jgi:hypothetical protein
VAVAPIIRTCSTLALLLIGAPLAAQEADSATLDAYVQGRLLDAAGAGVEAALAYSAALSGAPTDERIATRAFAQALEAGDKPLAIRAARALDAQGKLPGDGRLLLYIDAVSRNDWRGAGIQLDKMDGGNFDFLVPIFRAWVASGARETNPYAPLDVRPLQALTGAYAREQRMYLLLARKESIDGKTLARSLATSDPRSAGLRVAAAARLAGLKDREGATSLLEGGDAVTVKARAVLAAGGTLGGGILTPSDAAGILMARLAGDLLRDNAAATALRLARLGAFAAPDNAEVALVLAQALSAAGFQQPALATLSLWDNEPLFVSARRDVRFGSLQRLGRDDEALAMAKAIADATGADLFDYARLGDALTKRREFAPAAAAYRKAIDRAEAREGNGVALWNLWLLYGGALDAAGDWANAKPALQKARTA